jgi:hydroxyethylthiazole kinase
VDRGVHFGYDLNETGSFSVEMSLIATFDDLPATLHLVRLHQPVVHAITNFVTADDVAGVLRAIGGRPIMAVSGEEVCEIVAQADALLLNLGTPTPERIEAMLMAGREANRLHKPVVFDPVGAGSSRFRMDSCGRILSELKLALIKGNPAEIGVLAGMGGRLRGVDAVSGPADLRQSAAVLSNKSGAAVVVTGSQDIVVDGEQAMAIENGHPIMAEVIGTGCMLGAIIAAFLAVAEGRMRAASAALVCFGIAGQRAAARAEGIGTFKAAFLDSLSSLTPEELRVGMKIRWIG